MITDKHFFRGFELDFSVDSPLIDKLFKYKDSLYYLNFSKIIVLEELRENLFNGILGGDNKVLTLRYNYSKIKTVKCLSWNIYFNMLTFYSPEGLFTLQFSRAGVKIYPSSSDYDLNLNKAIDFILKLDRAGFLEVSK